MSCLNLRSLGQCMTATDFNYICTIKHCKNRINKNKYGPKELNQLYLDDIQVHIFYYTKNHILVSDHKTANNRMYHHTTNWKLKLYKMNSIVITFHLFREK